tara:strand:+ start:7924 stop:8271 length:348 start_codon:yes stop_codon:yes gene_type:complete
LLHAAKVRGCVFLETTRQESARGVAAREEVVGATRAVGRRGDGDVVDGAIEGEVDWFLGVGAVVGGEFGVGEVDFALLENVLVCACCRMVEVRVGKRWRRTRMALHSRARVHQAL